MNTSLTYWKHYRKIFNSFLYLFLILLKLPKILVQRMKNCDYLWNLTPQIFPLYQLKMKHLKRKQKKLFTPGPLNCTLAVKQAMLHDYGSRDVDFIDVVKDVRQRLLDIAGVSPVEWTIVPLQGSGTYCVEAAIHTAVPKDKDARVLVLSNGAYGRRLAKICDAAEISHDVLEFGEAQPYDLAKVERQLSSRRYACVAAVHCETSCGLLNPVGALASSLRARQPQAAFVVDAMSSFGALPARLDRVDFLVSSANKCLQGVPGFGFVLARTQRLATCAGNARTLCLDLVAQHAELERSGQFRFTPPTHALLAAQQALRELESEGGPAARRRRYEHNASLLVSGARELGLRPLLPPDSLCPIITAFLYPRHARFRFDDFYQRLSALGQVIYPGKVTTTDCFRIGCVGDLHPNDVRHLLKCIGQVLEDMGVPIPVP